MDNCHLLRNIEEENSFLLAALYPIYHKANIILDFGITV